MGDLNLTAVAEEMMGHVRTPGRLLQVEAGSLCSMQQRSCQPVEGSKGGISLLKRWAVTEFLTFLYVGLATPTVTSFLLSQLFPLLRATTASSLTLPPALVVLVRSPARPDCRN